MPKLLLMSVLIVTVAFPILFSKGPNARAGLRASIFAFMGFMVLWTIFCAYVYTDIAKPPKVFGQEIDPHATAPGEYPPPGI